MSRTIDHRQETGAVAVVVAICLMGLLGIAALAIDLGSAWSTKRNLVTDTDAAALAGAKLLQRDCTNLGIATTEARSVLRANAGAGASIPDADILVEPVPGSGVCEALRVTYTGEAQTTFAGAVGTSTLEVLSSSTAVVPVVSAGGLRPITVCLSDPAVGAGWALDGVGGAHSDVYTYTFDKVFDNKKAKAGDPACGSASGNWGWACFDQGHDKVHKHDTPPPDACNGTSDRKAIARMLVNGYDGVVDLGSTSGNADDDCSEPGTGKSDVTDCDLIPGNKIHGGSKTDCPGDPMKSAECAIWYLWDQQITFPILGVSSYDAGGSNGVGTPQAFIGVRVHSYDFDAKPEFVRFELVDLFDSGTSATLTTGTPTTFGTTQLCANDSTDYTGC